MGIDSVMGIAITGLTATQTAMRTTSNNITNVNTEGYQRKIADFQTDVNAGVGAGVSVAEIKRLTDIFLSGQVRDAESATERYDAMVSLHERFQSLLGSPGDNSSIAGRLDQVFDGFAALPIEPDSLVRRTAAVNDLKNFADNISLLANQLQLLRAEADRQIAETVSTINSQLVRINDLNQEISKQKLLSGVGAADLEGQRDQALSLLAEFMDVDTFKFTGKTGVTGAGGLVLVDQLARSLSFTQSGTVTSTTRFPQITINKIDPVTGAEVPTGEALDPNIKTGRVKGLIEMRDEVLPNFALQLGEFAKQISDQLNAIHNDNTPIPPLTTMTGRNTGLVGTDLTGFTGKTTFVTMDASNNYVNRLEVDFTNNTTSLNGAAAAGATLTTLADVVTAVNAQMGAGTLSFGTGVMTYSVPAGATSVAIYQDSTSPSDRGGRGFAHFFGLNDLMESQVQSHADTGLLTTSAHGFGNSGVVQLEFRGPQNQIPASFDLDFASVGGTAMSDVLTSLNATGAFSAVGTFTLDSNGALVMTPKSGFEKYKMVLVGDTTNRSGTKLTFSEFFGVGDKYVANAAAEMKVKDAILADPKLLSLAKIDTSSTATAGTVPALTPGDGRGAVEFQQLAEKAVVFNAAGHLAGVTTTLSSYAGAVLSDMATQSAISQRLQEDRKALSGELSARLEGETGVNLDEELALMVVYQNAYNASARLIGTAREMMDTLMQIAG